MNQYIMEGFSYALEKRGFNSAVSEIVHAARYGDQEKIASMVSPEINDGRLLAALYKLAFTPAAIKGIASRAVGGLGKGMRKMPKMPSAGGAASRTQKALGSRAAQAVKSMKATPGPPTRGAYAKAKQEGAIAAAKARARALRGAKPAPPSHFDRMQRSTGN